MKDRIVEELKRHKILKYTRRLEEITKFVYVQNPKVAYKYAKVNGEMEKLAKQAQLKEKKVTSLNFELTSLGQLFPALRTLRGQQVMGFCIF